MDKHEWITLAQAIVIIAPHYGETVAKELILRRTRAKLIKRRVARLKVENFKTSAPEFEDYAKQLIEKCEIAPIFEATGHYWKYGEDFEAKETENSDHWSIDMPFFADSQKVWITRKNERVVNQYYADWEISEFKHACLSWPELDHEFGDSENYSIRTMHAIGIEVEAEFVERLVPNNLTFETIGSQPSRNTKYDWGAAMSHLIAMAEIDGLVSDPHAHGAQAIVERAMADWFATNANQLPSEAMVRTYAAKVIQAMKAYRTKG
jgi:hypothetical protein